MEARDTCLYIHCRKTDGLIFYVGIGNARRPYKGSKRSEWWSNVVNKHGYDVHVLQEGLTWEEACQLEQMLIAEFKSDAAAGIAKLVNQTDGGDGTKGWNKNAEWLANVVSASRAVKTTPEWREKHVEAMRKLKTDPAWRARSIEANRRKAADPEFRARNAEAMRAKNADPEYKEKFAEAMRKRESNPEYKKNRVEAIRAAIASPEWRERHGDAMRKRAADPAYKAKMSATTKASVKVATHVANLNKQHYTSLWPRVA